MSVTHSPLAYPYPPFPGPCAYRGWQPPLYNYPTSYIPCRERYCPPPNPCCNEICCSTNATNGCESDCNGTQRLCQNYVQNLENCVSMFTSGSNALCNSSKLGSTFRDFGCDIQCVMNHASDFISNVKYPDFNTFCRGGACGSNCCPDDQDMKCDLNYDIDRIFGPKGQIHGFCNLRCPVLPCQNIVLPGLPGYNCSTNCCPTNCCNTRRC